MEVWHDFWVAQVGASAALAGLLFVSISINLAKILENADLPDRAAIPFILLLGILVSCSLLLAPDESELWGGIQILICGIAVWGTVTYLDVKRIRKSDKHYWKAEPLRLLLTQLSSLPYIAAGVLLASGNLGGLNWIVLAAIASFVKSFSDAWVLLVEINR